MTAANASSLQRLELLQRLAGQQEDQAARQLADALAKHANAEDRRAELQQYELEYAARIPAGAGVAALRDHAGFLAKLRAAVGFQCERTQLLAAEVERARARWVGLHREVEKLAQLETGARHELRQLDARRQSRESDELAVRGWMRQQAVG